MANLSEELLTIISKTKQILYPATTLSAALNESALDAHRELELAWKYLERAAETIKARGSS